MRIGEEVAAGSGGTEEGLCRSRALEKKGWEGLLWRNDCSAV